VQNKFGANDISYQQMKNPSEFRGISLVRVTGIEPAHLAAREPNGRVTIVELFFNAFISFIIS
jgi:hypothetical protein